MKVSHTPLRDPGLPSGQVNLNFRGYLVKNVAVCADVFSFYLFLLFTSFFLWIVLSICDTACRHETILNLFLKYFSYKYLNMLNNHLNEINGCGSKSKYITQTSGLMLTELHQSINKSFHHLNLLLVILLFFLIYRASYQEMPHSFVSYWSQVRSWDKGTRYQDDIRMISGRNQDNIRIISGWNQDNIWMISLWYQDNIWMKSG